MAGLAKDRTVAVIGAGTMGAGIAQVAAAAGHPVLLYDAAAGAAAAGRERLARGLAGLVAKGKIPAEAADALIGRIGVAAALADLAPAALVIEAIVERLDIKQGLFSQLEDIVAADAVLATNTSSLSITAIAAPLQHPGRMVGMHFFNPAPVMKLVEVVSGLATAPEVAALVSATATDWGKVAVPTRSTPGFIVNRVARAYYGEALRLAEEGVADPATLDALLTHGGGFRMGPFALMDLIGHDVNYAVSQSVFKAYHYEPRFRPSILQRELVDAGRLGRKTGRGFFDYAEGAAMPEPATVAAGDTAPLDPPPTLAGEDRRPGLLIALTDGRLAAERAREAGQPVILHDLLEDGAGRKRLGFTASPGVSAAQKDGFVAALAAQDIAATELPDWPGLVVMRTIAAIANEGFEAVLQQVADEPGVDDAMRYGVNYPKGPMAWARQIGLARILSVLEALQHQTGDMRYRPSFGLRRAAAS
ncbi:3-hydroxyacyl-CoA dehydrogenase NAD-binding domain-containing protein [Paracoccus sp. J39]|uniref:3-hydroxyacyl-CoA dehydrogenase NAD-binding domain-containing protein n=1 Tax=Paracoccus sp. J39 TaxID=935848 RepID=UPI00048CDB48|nr:3-hydroxyacyl-CoA dehydrogenase NAD-binding domain-containing protein [Paracoccus sp. J39]